MHWQKKGLVYCANGQPEWMQSHCQVPAILELEDRVRVYFSTRPEPTISLMGYVDLDPNNLTKVMGVSQHTVLPLGQAGAFDEFGVMPGNFVKHEGKIYAYYTGWSRGTSVPYFNGIGLAVSEDDGQTFTKMFEGPILDRSPLEPFTTYANHHCFLIHKGTLL